MHVDCYLSMQIRYFINLVVFSQLCNRGLPYLQQISASSNTMRHAGYDAREMYIMRSNLLNRNCLRVESCNHFNLSCVFRGVPLGTYDVVWRMNFDSEFYHTQPVLFTSCVHTSMRYVTSLMPRWTIADSLFGTESMLKEPNFYQREDWVSIRVGRVQVTELGQKIPVKFWMKWAASGSISGLTIDSVSLEERKTI